VQFLLADISQYCSKVSIEVILTLNVNEAFSFDASAYEFPIHIIRNATPKGFAANHNQAFRHTSAQYFCVVNPDIRLLNDPFCELLTCLKEKTVGVVAPLVVGSNGLIEDSARHFPSPLRILCKLFGGCQGGDYVIGEAPVHPDWVGGMFMLFPRSVFERAGGFDQHYFLYYEDVDLCARLKLNGYEVVLWPVAKVVHHAHRSSHHSFKFFRWHLSSMMRFFFTPVYWRVQCRKWL
jgi:hypothetical protein